MGKSIVSFMATVVIVVLVARVIHHAGGMEWTRGDALFFTLTSACGWMMGHFLPLKSR